MMKLKHKCLYCQHTASRMWNLRRHIQSVHGIEKSNSYANSDDVIPHHQSKYQPSQDEAQYGKRYKDASTKYSENDINHSTVPLDTTNTADQMIQKKEAQLFEYDSNIVEVLESKRRCFENLCSLSKWDMIRHMISDQYINLIIEACRNLSYCDEIRRRPYYNYLLILANENENVQYKRRILQEKGPEIVCLINSFILPLLARSIENVI